MASVEAFWLSGWGAPTTRHASASGTTVASGSVRAHQPVSAVTYPGPRRRPTLLLHGGRTKHASVHGLTLSLGAAAGHRDLTGRRRREEQDLLLLAAL